MPYKDQFGFKGIYPDLEPQDIPDGGFVLGTENVRAIDNVLTQKAGYEKLQATALLGVPLRAFRHTEIDGTEHLIVATTTDVYRFDDSTGAFKLLTEHYATGTITSDATPFRVITLAGGTWDVTWDDYANPCYIGFTDDDPDDITTWYEVDSIDNATQITIVATEDPPDNTAGNIKFVLRRQYNATTEYRWNCESFYDGNEDENLLVLTNGVDYPMKWVSDTAKFCEVLGGTPPRSKYVTQLGGRLIFGNIIAIQGGMTGSALGLTLIWSPVSDAEAWTGGTTDDAGYQELYETAGSIRFMATFGYYVCIGKSDSIILLNTSGIVAAPFVPNYVIRGQGSGFDIFRMLDQSAVPFANTEIVRGQGLAFLTEDDIVLFDGTPNLISLAEKRIRKTFFSNFNADKGYAVVDTYSSRFDEWRIYVPAINETYPTHTWIYKIKTGEWFYDDVGFTAVGAHDYRDGVTIDELTGTIDALALTIDSYGGARVFKEVIMCDSSGYVYIEDPDLDTLNLAAIEAVAITKDYAASDLNVTDRYQEIFVLYRQTGLGDGTFRMALSLDRGVSWTGFQTVTPSLGSDRGEARTSWNKTGKVCRVMFDGQAFKIYGFKVLYVPQGIR